MIPIVPGDGLQGAWFAFTRLERAGQLVQLATLPGEGCRRFAVLAHGPYPELEDAKLAHPGAVNPRDVRTAFCCDWLQVAEAVFTLEREFGAPLGPALRVGLADREAGPWER